MPTGGWMLHALMVAPMVAWRGVHMMEGRLPANERKLGSKPWRARHVGLDVAASNGRAGRDPGRPRSARSGEMTSLCSCDGVYQT